MGSRYATARQSAWRQFGRRHYRWFVGVDVARAAAGPVSVLVLLGAVGYGLWWAWQHVSPGWLALWSALAGMLLLGGFLARRVWSGASVGRAVPLTGPAVAVLASVVLLFGASITALVR